MKQKRFLLSLMMLALVALTGRAEASTTLWDYETDNSSTAIVLNWGSTVGNPTIAASAFSTAQVGDYVQVTVTENNSNSYPQIHVYSNSSRLTGTCSFLMTKGSGETTAFRFCITYDGLAQLQASGMYATGAGVDLKKIELVSTSSTEDYTDAVWFGNRVCSWNGVNLNAATFASAATGYTLRVHHTDLGESSKLSLRTNSGEVSGYGYAAVGGSYTDYTVNDDILTAMNGGEFRVYGNQLTITKIELFNPDETVLWRGMADLTGSDWGTYATINTARAAKLKAGDKITVTVNTASKTATAYPSVQFYSGSTALSDQLQYWNEVAAGTAFPMAKDLYLSSSDIEAIASNGLKMVGGGCCVTKVTYKAFEPMLWEGVTSELNWNEAYTMSKGLVADIVANDIIRVTVASSSMANTQWPTLRFSSKSENSSRKDEYNTVALQSTAIYANSTPFECPYAVDYVVPEADLDVLHEKNSLYLTGKGITLSKVELVKYVAPVPTMDVAYNLWKGEQTMADSWAGYITISASQLANVQTGDRIRITIPRISAPSVNPAIALDNGSWGNLLGDNVFVSLSDKTASAEAPYVYVLALTDELAATLRGETADVKGGLYIAGRGYDVSRVDLVRSVETTSAEGLGNAVTNLWSGETLVKRDQANSATTYVSIAKDKFSGATAGQRIRVKYKGASMASRGRLLYNYTALSDAYNLTTDCGNYFDVTLTDAMLANINATSTTHVRVAAYTTDGYQFTVTSVDLIDPAKELTIVSQFDTDDIRAWEPGETQKISVTLTNTHTTAVTTSIEVQLETDMFAYYKTITQNDVQLAAGETKTVDVPLDITDPGFYRMTVNANLQNVCSYYIGYNPTAIVSPDDSQSDFWTFWDGWKDKLAAIDIDATMTLLSDKSTGSRNVYEVKYQSVPDTDGGTPVYIYGYYAEPKAEGNYPCRINFHGTDTGTGTVSVPDTDKNTDWCEFNFSARGQMLNRVKNGQTYGTDFYGYELGDNDKHYYRMVYLDTRRAVDFVYSQQKVNKNAIFAAGGSQGGCLTYVCAALSDGMVKAIAPSITGHADFVHTMEIVTWPTNVFNNWINAKVTDGTYANYEEGKDALLKHQSYFDTKNFASRITCPVITNFSLQDHTDGPHLNISPYNLLTKVAKEDKQYIINPFLGHGTFSGWENTYMTFFNQYINKEPLNMTAAEYGTYYNSTAVQLPAGVKAATIDGSNSETNTLTINWRYDGDDATKSVIPGGTAVMLKSEAGNYKLTLLPENTDDAPTGNLLHGSDVRTTTTGGDVYYKLAYGNSSGSNANVLGWYWGAADGAAFTISGGKAWLALTKAQAQSAPFFTLDESNTTAISNIGQLDSLQSGKWYDLQGRQIVKSSNSQMKPGLYIVNGKKRIIH